MAFSSVIFVCVFLPAVCILNWAIPGVRGRNILLAAASLLFYAFGDPAHLLLLLGSVLFNYAAGLLAARPWRWSRLVLWAAVAGNLGVLAFYKYLGFLAENLSLLLGVSLPVPAVALPLGISFFTFQGLSYVIDVYRDKSLATRSFFDLLLYICLFPRLVAGPILKYQDVAGELHCRAVTLDGTARGVRRFILGLTKKLLLSDTATGMVNAVFALEAGQVDFRLAWLGAVGYALQIYFDFSGYSDMAIGLGWIFGFHFKENFRYPYAAASVKEFWRRWHISLSTWFRDYLYIPLGGNRKGKVRTYCNKLIVFFCTGLWHGASWTYVVWGLWHGVFLVAEDRLRPAGRHGRPARWLGHLYTLLVAVVGFVFFRAATLGQAAEIIRSMFTGFAVTAESAAVLASLASPLHLWVLAAGCIGCLPWLDRVKQWAAKHPVLEAASYPAALALFGLDLVHLSAASFVPFIYFQF